jgi:hypothetical protein
MTSKRKFRRTVIQVEILSEGDEAYDPEDLGAVVADIATEGYSGAWEIARSEVVDGAEMATFLQEQATDPGFFQLDAEGNDIED